MASYQYVYVMKDLTKAYPGGREVFKGITLSFFPGAKIGVLGVNGARQIDAAENHRRDREGIWRRGLCGRRCESRLSGAGTRISNPTKNVGENVAERLCRAEKDLGPLQRHLGRIRRAGWTTPRWTPCWPNRRSCRKSSMPRKAGTSTAGSRSRWTRCAARRPDAAVGPLSGGERRRVALCRLLLEKPDILLLDEPTNHLDAESVAWLERTLADYAGTVILVTHDRYFLDNVTNWILEIERGRGYPYEGNYSAWLEQKQKRLAQEEKEESSRQRALAEEREWISSSPKARQTKSRARIQRYEELLAKSQELGGGVAEITIPPGPRLGGTVIEAIDLRKGFGDRELIDGLNFKLPPGGIVGVIGPNGAGKTTLFKMITGGDKPDSGSLKIGETVKLGYVDQSRDSLDGNKNVWEEISGGTDVIHLGKRTVASRAYVGAFNFKGSDQQKKVGILSGGERNRVHLAKMLKSEANVILLDEPTNDLDVDTLRALEDALMEFAGCAVIISHDRWFLDRLATHILAFEGDSHVEWFEGNFQAYEEDKRRRLGIDAAEPHRIKYRPLTR